MNNNGNGSVRPNRVRPYLDPLDEAMTNQLVANLTSERMEVLRRQTGGVSDPRRSIASECGFPEGAIGLDYYRNMYERNPIAKRVVEVLPHESWQTQPQVYEDEDPEVSTHFEHSWDDLGRNLRGGSLYQDEEGSPVWEYLHRVDVLSGIGHFGIILLGIDDGKDLQEPVEGSVTTNTQYANWETVMSKSELDYLLEKFPKDEPVLNRVYVSEVAREARDKVVHNKVQTSSGNDPFGPSPTSQMGTDAQYFGWYGKTEFQADKPSGKKRELMFLRVFPEYLVQVVRYESNLRNARFGQPVMYRITLNDPRDQHSGVGLPIASIYVHWSRVVHVADNLQGGSTSSEVFGVPRQRPVFNNLLSLEKLYGASGEAYWKACVNALAFNTHPQLGGDVAVNMDDMRDQVENFQNSIQRFLTGIGGTWASLAPTVSDPTPHITMHLEAICICIGCPIRIFKGSERGELASSQDDGAWNDRLKFRQYMYISPKIIVPFVDRLILLGILPQPKKSAEEVVANWRRRGYVINRAFGGYCVYESAEMRCERELSARAARRSTWNAEEAVPSDNLPDQKTRPAGPNPNASEISKPKPVAFVGGGGYSIQWKDLESNTQLDKANIANLRTTALAAYVSGGIENLMPEFEYLTHIMEFDDEEAKAILEAKEKNIEDSIAEHGDMVEAGEEHDLVPTPPPGFEAKPPEPPPMPGMPGGPPIPPQKLGAGQQLVHPETGKTIAKAPFPPKPEGASRRGNPTKNAQDLAITVTDEEGTRTVKWGPVFESRDYVDMPTENEEWPVVFNQEEMTENCGGEGSGVPGPCPSAASSIADYSKQWSKGLTEDEKEAINDYTMDPAVNDRLRSGSTNRHDDKLMSSIDDALGKASLPEDTTVYRATSIEVGESETYIEDGYTSASSGMTIPEDFSDREGGSVVAIRLPKGFPAASIASLSRSYASEGEILIPRGTEFKNVGKDPQGRTILEPVTNSNPDGCNQYKECATSSSQENEGEHLKTLKTISDEFVKGSGGRVEVMTRVDQVLSRLSKEQLKEAAEKFGSRSAKGRKERVEGIKRFISDRREMYQRTIKNSFCPTGEGGGVDPSCSPGDTSTDYSMITHSNPEGCNQYKACGETLKDHNTRSYDVGTYPREEADKMVESIKQSGLGKDEIVAMAKKAGIKTFGKSKKKVIEEIHKNLTAGHRARDMIAS